MYIFIYKRFLFKNSFFVLQIESFTQKECYFFSRGISISIHTNWEWKAKNWKLQGKNSKYLPWLNFFILKSLFYNYTEITRHSEIKW